MIVCPNCSKENQDHYKFCLGCGSDLPRPEAVEEKHPTPTPPTGIPAMNMDAAQPLPIAQTAVSPTPEPVAPAVAPTQEAAAPVPMQEEAPVEAPAATEVACPSCGATIPPGFAFCGACGTPVPGLTPSPAPSPAPSAVSGFSKLVLIQPDGTEGGHVEIPASEVAIGRDAGGFFESDPFLSPTHATFMSDGDEVVVRDAGSLNGVFAKLSPNEPVEIKSGEIFRIGQELILFEEIDRGGAAPDGTEKMGSPIEGLWGRVSLIVGQGRLGNAFPVGGEAVVFGRERGNILFPEDGYVSGMHLKLYTENNQSYLCDLESSNGSFIKVQGEIRLRNGSFLLMGQQLFRIDV